MHVPPHGAQRLRLRLAAPFGDRLGEVREQHGEPEPGRDREDEPGRPAPAIAPTAAARPMTVVRMLPTKTTNITGLRNWTRGSSFLKESLIAANTIGRVTIGFRGEFIGVSLRRS